MKKLKRIIYAGIMALSAVCFSACAMSSDDDNNSESQELKKFISVLEKKDFYDNTKLDGTTTYVGMGEAYFANYDNNFVYRKNYSSSPIFVNKNDIKIDEDGKSFYFYNKEDNSKKYINYGCIFLYGTYYDWINISDYKMDGSPLYDYDADLYFSKGTSFKTNEDTQKDLYDFFLNEVENLIGQEFIAKPYYSTPKYNKCEIKKNKNDSAPSFELYNDSNYDSLILTLNPENIRHVQQVNESGDLFHIHYTGDSYKYKIVLSIKKIENTNTFERDLHVLTIDNEDRLYRDSKDVFLFSRNVSSIPPYTPNNTNKNYDDNNSSNSGNSENVSGLENIEWIHSNGHTAYFSNGTLTSRTKYQNGIYGSGTKEAKYTLSGNTLKIKFSLLDEASFKISISDGKLTLDGGESVEAILLLGSLFVNSSGTAKMTFTK